MWACAQTLPLSHEGSGSELVKGVGAEGTTLRSVTDADCMLFSACKTDGKVNEWIV